MSTVESNDNILDVRLEPEPKRVRKSSSSVWMEYEKLPVDTDGKQRAKCKRCGKKYIVDYGTTNLKRHLANCRGRDNFYLGPLLLPPSSAPMQNSSTFDQEKFNELIIMAIIRHDLPYQFVEHEGFRDLCSFLNSEVNPITVSVAKAEILELYKKHREGLHHLLQSVSGRVCLMLDSWKSTTDEYLCVTAHFIDEEWGLQRKILNFCYMPPPHSAVSLAEKVSTVLDEWGIEKKLFSITVDSTSSNDEFVELMKNQLSQKIAFISDGQFFHVRCCTNIINLIVQDGLKEVEETVNKIRESVRYVKNSQLQKTKFLECVSQLSFQSNKGLHHDIPTRWNMTYHMLESAIVYRQAFCNLEAVDSDYKSCPSPEEWTKVENVVKFFKVFYDVISIFSRVKCPTANLYFHGVWRIQLRLKEETESVDSFASKMAKQIQEKFEKYWKDYSLILAIAVVLDPRYKMQFVEYSYMKLYGENSRGEVMRVRQHLYAIFDEYIRLSPKASASNVSANTHRSGSNDGDDGDDLQDFEKFESERFSNERHKSQLDMYLQEPKRDHKQELDILKYWKACKYCYPELSSMAHDILTLPTSAVASEEAFNIGDKVLDQYHSALSQQNLEALICTRNWLFGSGVDDFELKIDDDIYEDILTVADPGDVTHGSDGVGV